MAKNKKKVIKRVVRKKVVKKKPVVKKVSKKKVTRKATQKSVEVVVKVAPVPIGKALEPIREKSKYALPATWVSERQLLTLLQQTPKEHVHNRPAKGGGTWDYVTGVYVKKVLNFVFGWNWDFEVISAQTIRLGEDGGQVIVLGKLTVRGKTENEKVVKMQYGRADIKYKKGTKIPLDLGNDHKTASTDSLKKCASELGVASDIYGKNEFKNLGVSVDTPPTPPLASSPKVEFKNCTPCQGNCGAIVEPNVVEYSKKMFRGKIYCRDCQKLKNGKH